MTAIAQVHNKFPQLWLGTSAESAPERNTSLISHVAFPVASSPIKSKLLNGLKWNSATTYSGLDANLHVKQDASNGTNCINVRLNLKHQVAMGASKIPRSYIGRSLKMPSQMYAACGQVEIHPKSRSFWNRDPLPCHQMVIYQMLAKLMRQFWTGKRSNLLSAPLPQHCHRVA